MNNDPWTTFLSWEQTSRDTIDFKTIYVDMADDLVAGLLLSQIIYWYLPSKKGQSKLRVFKDGYYWIAKARHKWWDEIRVKPRQIDRAIAILEEKGIIITHLYRFNNAPTTHIRIDKEGFLTAWDIALAQFNETGKSEIPSDPFSPNLQFDLTDSANPDNETEKSDLPKSAKSLTETIIDFPEITAENTSDFPEKPKADPLLFEKERETANAQATTPNFATPPSAGGSDAAAEAALTAMYRALNSGPAKRGSGSWKQSIENIGQALRDHDVTEPDVARQAGRKFGEANIETPQFVNPHLSTFPTAFGIYVGMAKKQADKAKRQPPPPDDYEPVYLEEPAPAANGDCPVGAAVKGELELQMSKPNFDAWVKPSSFVQEDSILIVTTAGAETRDWLEGRVADMIRRIAVGVLGRAVEVEFKAMKG